MERRGALVAASLAAALVAVWAAASDVPGSRVVANGAVQSLTLSILLPFVVLAVLVVLVGLVVGLRPRHPDGEDDERGRGARLLPIVLAGTALLVFAGIAWTLLRGRRRALLPHLAAGAATSHVLRTGGRTLPINAGAFGATSGILVVLMGVFLLRRVVGPFARRPGATIGHDAEPGAVAAPGGGPAAERRPSGPAELPDPAGERDPRRAIVLAYQRFAAAMERAGFGRAKQETPFEYAGRLASTPAATSAAAQDAALRLTSLFSLARYGRQPVSYEDRSAALGYLATISDDLGARP